MVLDKDFREFIESLNANDVRYLVVGGYAVGFLAEPRYTKDIDIWVEREEENLKRLVKALHQFGVGSLGFGAKDFIDPNAVVQLGVSPYRIDVLSGLDGVDFETCFSSRIEVDDAGLKVNVIDAENLMKNKQRAGRPQDIADVENLKRHVRKQHPRT